MDETAVVLWVGFILALVLTLRALVSRSWLLMWAATLGTIPFLLSSLGIYTILLTSFQLGAAAAWRHRASERGWVTFLLVSFLVWIAVYLSVAITDIIWVWEIPVLPLSLLAWLLPLVPVERLEASRRWFVQPEPVANGDLHSR